MQQGGFKDYASIVSKKNYGYKIITVDEMEEEKTVFKIQQINITIYFKCIQVNSNNFFISKRFQGTLVIFTSNNISSSLLPQLDSIELGNSCNS